MVKYIVGIVGSRNTGKTTTTTNITDTLVKKGFKAAIIKFMSHRFDFDPAHKDSALLRKTKATTILSASPHETVLFQKTDQRTDLHTLLRYLPLEIDDVLCESYPSTFPVIPLIFVCQNIEDYYNTKERFKDRKPLFITGIIVTEGIDTLEGIPVLSNDVSDHLQQALELILRFKIEISN
ncbi:MAG: molybdopterin-guanine dinucleotide biosynthesis protein MobB [Candidatus Heimdallarchaeota archaeon]|nr:MAG: molybdopterin-guanine dinucleotide biosynthesis protein MobB [Candidatus Heimdallarchaeota archaeon]